MLLKTRFYIPPLRKQSVLRRHLVDRLNATGGGELIVVSAPAGYGKTTVVSQWLHANPHTFSWLIIDQSQSSPAVFWEYVISAVNNVQPDIGDEALRILKEFTGESLESVVISLLNDLDELCTHNNSQEPITLVLDDFHHVESPQTLRLVNLFLDHLPSSIRIVLTSRTEPALALSRRRANNQLQELDVKDLVFQLDEGKTFFNKTMGLSLADQMIEDYCAKTEGWVVGLQLAALSLQKSAVPSQSVLDKESLNRHISDYLFDEVFSLQAPELQEFLMVSACVPRFCAGLCNDLVGKAQSLSFIAQLDQLNLFLVPLDNHRTWFRYHDLFRQFLLQRFFALPELLQKESYQRSALWLEAAGYLDEALDQFILCQDWPKSVRLLEQVALEKNQQGHCTELKHWLAKIPQQYHQQLTVLTASVMAAEKNTPSEERTDPVVDSPSINPQVTGVVEPLTRRETQVMDLVSQGMPNKKIASTLNISLNTLKVHIRNLYGKMGVENRTQALLKITQNSEPSK